MLGAFVLVDLYFFGCDLLTSAFPNGSGAEVVAMLMSGPLAPFFWIEIVGCALLRRGVLRAEAAHEPVHRGRIVAGHRRYFLQARAVAGGRLPDSESSTMQGPQLPIRLRDGNPVWPVPTRAWCTGRRRLNSASCWAWLPWAYSCSLSGLKYLPLRSGSRENGRSELFSRFPAGSAGRGLSPLRNCGKGEPWFKGKLP